MAVVKLAAAGKGRGKAIARDGRLPGDGSQGRGRGCTRKRSLSSTFAQDVRKETVFLRGLPLKKTE
jgi:hypothetical protein